MRVFVYGTLRRGHGNHGTMQAAGGSYTHDAVIKGRLYKAGLPFLVPGDDDVSGEVFDVPERGVTTYLDWLEGHPSFYERRLTQTTEGEEVSAYFLNDPGYIQQLEQQQQ